MRILHVAGARPNFMKVAPVLRALEERGAHNVLVHTGQHYDPAMSAAFFTDLGLPEPDVHLEVGSGTHAAQTARIMERIEPVLLDHKPDLTVVVGDVNSTIAAALVCAKLLLPVAHVEAGLRSFDRTMPEEINRVLTDQIADLLFTTSPEAEDNLRREGVAPERIHFVGNPMIDSLERHLAPARASDVLARLGLDAGGYVLVTLHRPSNVDDPETLRGILQALRDASSERPSGPGFSARPSGPGSSAREPSARDGSSGLAVLFPIHPRTAKMIETFGLGDLVSMGSATGPGSTGSAGGAPAPGTVTCIEPLGYVDFLRLMADARVVVTDSGGIQEETTILGVPCLTVRWNTERPITCEVGTNTLIGTDPAKIREAIARAVASPPSEPQRPPLWDGKAGERIADVVATWGASTARPL